MSVVRGVLGRYIGERLAGINGVGITGVGMKVMPIFVRTVEVLVERAVELVVVGHSSQAPGGARLLGPSPAFLTGLGTRLEGDALEGPSLFEAPMPSLFHVPLLLLCLFVVVSA